MKNARESRARLLSGLGLVALYLVMVTANPEAATILTLLFGMWGLRHLSSKTAS